MTQIREVWVYKPEKAFALSAPDQPPPIPPPAPCQLSPAALPFPSPTTVHAEGGGLPDAGLPQPYDDTEDLLFVVCVDKGLKGSHPR